MATIKEVENIIHNSHLGNIFIIIEDDKDLEYLFTFYRSYMTLNDMRIIRTYLGYGKRYKLVVSMNGNNPSIIRYSRVTNKKSISSKKFIKIIDSLLLK